uniref:Uncharacterized protein n=1 Tax=Anguilla anguilla TaxID=7936 RepID=A0A0E9Q0F3_ANGAN
MNDFLRQRAGLQNTPSDTRKRKNVSPKTCLKCQMLNLTHYKVGPEPIKPLMLLLGARNRSRLRHYTLHYITIT